MTTSPYDNLPSGNTEKSTKPEQSAQDTSYEDVTETLEYIDVEIENSAPAVEAAPEPQTIPSKLTPVPSARYRRINISNLCDTADYILPFEETLLVPDTMPDMHRCLFAEGKITLAQTDKYSYTSNDFISGDITVYTLYIPDNNQISPLTAVKSAIPFKTDKCWDNCEGSSFRAEICLKSISAEMINERKFTVRGELLISITGIMQEELVLFSGTDDKNLICANHITHAADLIFETHEKTEISQEISIGDDKPSPVKILKDSIHVTETHRQITSGKLVINAAIHSQILYEGLADGETKLSCLTNKTDFTQFIPVDEDMDTRLFKIRYDSSQLKVSVENENDFILHGEVSTFIQGFKNRSIETVCDAYHKSRSIHFDNSNSELTSAAGTVGGEISAREVISIGENEQTPQTLLCGNIEITDVESHVEHGKIVIEGTASVKITALDENNEAFIIQKSIPLRGSLEAPENTENVIPDTAYCIRDFWFDKINLRQIEVNISIALEIWLKQRVPFCGIENICFTEDSEPSERIPLAVYVTGRSDSLWDIAKRYRSDVDTLAALNQLDPKQPLHEGMKLLIAK